MLSDTRTGLNLVAEFHVSDPLYKHTLVWLGTAVWVAEEERCVPPAELEGLTWPFPDMEWLNTSSQGLWHSRASLQLVAWLIPSIGGCWYWLRG